MTFFHDKNPKGFENIPAIPLKSCALMQNLIKYNRNFQNKNVAYSTYLHKNV